MKTMGKTKQLHLVSGSGFLLAGIVFMLLAKNTGLGILFLCLSMSQFALANREQKH